MQELGEYPNPVHAPQIRVRQDPHIGVERGEGLGKLHQLQLSLGQQARPNKRFVSILRMGGHVAGPVTIHAMKVVQRGGLTIHLVEHKQKISVIRAECVLC